MMAGFFLHGSMLMQTRANWRTISIVERRGKFCSWSRTSGFDNGMESRLIIYNIYMLYNVSCTAIIIIESKRCLVFRGNHCKEIIFGNHGYAEFFAFLAFCGSHVLAGEHERRFLADASGIFASFPLYYFFILVA